MEAGTLDVLPHRYAELSRRLQRRIIPTSGRRGSVADMPRKQVLTDISGARPFGGEHEEVLDVGGAQEDSHVVQMIGVQLL